MALDYACIPQEENCEEFVKDRLKVENKGYQENGNNTRRQNECKEWFDQRMCRFTSSMIGTVLKRRISIYPRSIIKSITKPTATNNDSCQ